MLGARLDIHEIVAPAFLRSRYSITAMRVITVRVREWSRAK